MKWALAGRDLQKLTKIRAEIAGQNADLKSLPLIQADTNDEKSLAALAAQNPSNAYNCGSLFNVW